MPSIKIYNQTGKETGMLDLEASVFGVEYNESLIHQVIVAQRNNARQGTKCTLTRREVRGGGIKPWRQKGTGRARQGSIRAPQWIKGGVVFAPKPRDFSQKVNKQMKRNALVSALSAKVADEDMIVLDALKIENGKTKEMTAILKAFNLDKRVLVVTEGIEQNVLRASGNIANVKVLPVSQINVYDLVANAKCLITKEAIEKIQEAYKA